MREELDKKLVENYPKIFVNRFGDKRETAMCWGFECGDGWYWLIDQLCERIQSSIDNTYPKEKAPPQVIADQVKEKFGGLRFYFQGGNSEINGMVNLAEAMSFSICEHCGSTEKVTQNGRWIKSLCPTCIEERDNKK